jgi:DNA-binding FadR family transcriptional regulator
MEQDRPGVGRPSAERSSRRWSVEDLRAGYTSQGDAAEALPNLGQQNLRDRIAELIETRIMDGTFAAGTRLPTEVELQEQLGVSRTVVRDALRALEARGLIDIRRGRGTIVRPVNLEAYAEAVATFIVRSDLTMGDLMDARIVLEAALIRAAAQNREESDVRKIADAFDVFKAAADRNDTDEAARAHVAFHTALVRAARLRALSALLEPIQLMMIATSLVPEGFDPEDDGGWMVDTHEALRDAVASGDKAAVESAIEAHWATSQSRGYQEIRPRQVSAYYPSPRELLRQAGMPHGDQVV